MGSFGTRQGLASAIISLGEFLVATPNQNSGIHILSETWSGTIGNNADVWDDRLVYDGGSNLNTVQPRSLSQQTVDDWNGINGWPFGRYSRSSSIMFTFPI